MRTGIVDARIDDPDVVYFKRLRAESANPIRKRLSMATGASRQAMLESGRLIPKCAIKRRDSDEPMWMTFTVGIDNPEHAELRKDKCELEFTESNISIGNAERA